MPTRLPFPSTPGSQDLTHADTLLPGKKGAKPENVRKRLETEIRSILLRVFLREG
jgi:hypothetical protein